MHRAEHLVLVTFKPATSRFSATFSHAFIAPQRASQLHLCRVLESDGDKESPMQCVPTNTMTRSGRPEVTYPVQTQQPRISPVESRPTDQLLSFRESYTVHTISSRGKIS